MNASRYQRPHLAWIKRRARRLERCFDLTRRLAVDSASEDYRLFVGTSRPVLTLIRGGRS
ncbi:hypothetical protein [Variovorax paradoxus]|uniref:Uncharacterized protein n=1 Tax=Variovorax paradoxus TaxID=34073 RepID=A0A0H2MAE3_VARPD|nr:hypothetical protein [Variovorax paradoxus]KLN57642.1 hypothetical protein VPARA_11550 [Variovorax paradoxus]